MSNYIAIACKSEKRIESSEVIDFMKEGYLFDKETVYKIIREDPFFFEVSYDGKFLMNVENVYDKNYFILANSAVASIYIYLNQYAKSKESFQIAKKYINSNTSMLVVAVFNTDLVSMVLGDMTLGTRIVYGLIAGMGFLVLIASLSCCGNSCDTKK